MRNGRKGEPSSRTADPTVGAEGGFGEAWSRYRRAKGLVSRLSTSGFASGAVARASRRIWNSCSGRGLGEKRLCRRLLLSAFSPSRLLTSGLAETLLEDSAGNNLQQLENQIASFLRGKRRADIRGTPDTRVVAAPKAPVFSEFALSLLAYRRNRVYELGLLGPFVVHGLALKASMVVFRSGSPGLGKTLALMRSDAFFNLGYALFWVGMLSLAQRGPWRRAALGLFHTTTALVVVVRTTAHQYFRQTGTTLDYPIIALWLPRFDQIKPMLTHGVPRLAWALLAAALFYMILGPRLLTESIGWWRGWPTTSARGTSDACFRYHLWLCIVGLSLGSLSLPAGPIPANASKSFARDPFLNVVLTGLRRLGPGKKGRPPLDAKRPALETRLVRTPRTERRNVVLIHLESTRAYSVSPYNESMRTTPFLEELAKDSLLVQRAYTTVPHTSKASVSVHCGCFPDLAQEPIESRPGNLPGRGLPDLLREEGYRTVFFQSSVENFDDFGQLAKNFGYDEYFPIESMNTRGFEWSNYFGCEDGVMLGPSEKWLRGRGGQPLVTHYLTGTAHHDYRPPARYGHVRFAKDELLDRYLNCIRYLDFFVRELIQQYRDLGLYEHTIFVIYGDHGEAFGEHGRYGHEDVPYDEGLRIPLMIHVPGTFEGGKRVRGPSNLTDILPTVLDLLGYEVEGGEYPGYSLLRPLPEERLLKFSCFNEGKCLASLKGCRKYIYHYDDRPGEFFDLSRDPLEQKNLADERPEEVRALRKDLFG